MSRGRRDKQTTGGNEHTSRMSTGDAGDERARDGIQLAGTGYRRMQADQGGGESGTSRGVFSFFPIAGCCGVCDGRARLASRVAV
jgi:hypothetical protein